MFDTFRKFLSDLVEGGAPAHRFGDTDYRLAAAALLIHAAAIDGNATPAEKDRVRQLMQTRFELDDDTVDELMDEATEAEQEAIDLYNFTTALKRALDEPGRRRIVEMLWEIAYVDGRATELEDNLIWRAADLLGISRDERIALRQRVTGVTGIAADEN